MTNWKDDLPEWLKDVPPATDVEMALWNVASCLDYEIAELMTYAGLLGKDHPMTALINAEIKGMETAQRYCRMKEV